MFKTIDAVYAIGLILCIMSSFLIGPFVGGIYFLPFVRLGRSRAARFFKVLLSPRAAGCGGLGPQSSGSAGVRYRPPTSAAARVARQVMQQLNHPDNLKPHYDQSRVVASLSVATGLYHFVGLAWHSRLYLAL